MDIVGNRERWKDRLIIFALIGFILIGSVWVFGGKDLTSTEWKREVLLPAAMHALLTILLIAVLLELLTKKAFLREIKEVMLDLLVNDGKQLLHRLSPEARNQIVKNSVELAIPQNAGAQFYDHLFQPYLTGKFKLRSDYNYQLILKALSAEIRVPNSSVLFQVKDYCLIAETITYRRHAMTRASRVRLEWKWLLDELQARKEMKIGFAFTDRGLERLTERDDLYFREMLSLGADEVRGLTNLQPGALWNDLFVGILQLAVSIVEKVGNEDKEENLRPKPSQMEQLEDGEGVILTFALDPKHIGVARELDGRRIRIKFQMPQLKAGNHFLVTFPEPTKEPVVIFTWDRNLVKTVSSISFLPPREPNEDSYESPLGESGSRFQVNRWVFPRSGIVFFWNYG